MNTKVEKFHQDPEGGDSDEGLLGRLKRRVGETGEVADAGIAWAERQLKKTADMDIPVLSKVSDAVFQPALVGARAAIANLTSGGGKYYQPEVRDERYFSRAALKELGDSVKAMKGHESGRTDGMDNAAQFNLTQTIGGFSIKDGAVTDKFDINKSYYGVPDVMTNVARSILGAEEDPDAGKVKTRIPLDELDIQQDAKGGSSYKDRYNAMRDYERAVVKNLKPMIGPHGDNETAAQYINRSIEGRTKLFGSDVVRNAAGADELLRRAMAYIPPAQTPKTPPVKEKGQGLFGRTKEAIGVAKELVSMATDGARNALDMETVHKGAAALARPSANTGIEEIDAQLRSVPVVVNNKIDEGNGRVRSLTDADRAEINAYKETIGLQENAKGGDTRTAEGAGDTKGWTWENYRWNPGSKGGQRIDPENIKGTGIAFDKRDRAVLPESERKAYEKWMDELADPKGEWELENGKKVKVRSELVPKDWRTNKEFDRDYDYVRAYLAGKKDPELAWRMIGPVWHKKEIRKNGEVVPEGYWLHMNDVGKMPTHPTFSTDSLYAKDPEMAKKYIKLAGSWSGEEYIPGEAERSVRQAAGAGDTEGPEVPVEEPVPQSTGPVPDGPRIVINPSTFRNKKDALCVAWNERLRIWMEDNDFRPRSEPTQEQREFFSDTPYAKDELQMRRTILARIATLDTSIRNPTDMQLGETVEMLQGFAQTETPSNEYEAKSLSRIIELVDHVHRTSGANDEDLNELVEEPDEPEETGPYADDGDLEEFVREEPHEDLDQELLDEETDDLNQLTEEE